jgi:dihydroorotate dehydrogenase electron transfer subunit
MSVASVDVNRKELEIIFRVVGHGTAALAAYNRSMPIDILGPLGNRFDLPHKNDTVLIIAGGVGFPPLLYFATELVRRGFDPRQIEFFFGGRTASDILERARLKRLGVHFHPVTDDGSFGRKGLVTDAVEDHLSANPEVQVRLYGCGPEPMLKAVDELGQRNELPGQLSFEAPMPCGFGVCLGCVIPLRTGGHARVCCDGPVFRIGEVAL